MCPPSHSFQCPLHTHISLSQPADLGGGEQLRALPGAFRLVGCLLKTCESQNPGQMDWRPLQSLTPAHPPSPILSSLVLAGAGPQITLSPGRVSQTEQACPGARCFGISGYSKVSLPISRDFTGRSHLPEPDLLLHPLCS